MIRRSALVGAACIACLLGGWLVERWFATRAEYNAYGQLVAYRGKHEMPRPVVTPRTMVAFVFGQSNSANHGDEKFRTASPAAANFWNGKYFAAEDPLLGATGRGGSPWTLMANKLIEAGTFDLKFSNPELDKVVHRRVRVEPGKDTLVRVGLQ